MKSGDSRQQTSGILGTWELAWGVHAFWFSDILKNARPSGWSVAVDSVDGQKTQILLVSNHYLMFHEHCQPILYGISFQFSLRTETGDLQRLGFESSPRGLERDPRGVLMKFHGWFCWVQPQGLHGMGLDEKHGRNEFRCLWGWVYDMSTCPDPPFIYLCQLIQGTERWLQWLGTEAQIRIGAQSCCGYATWESSSS